MNVKLLALTLFTLAKTHAMSVNDHKYYLLSNMNDVIQSMPRVDLNAAHHVVAMGSKLLEANITHIYAHEELRKTGYAGNFVKIFKFDRKNKPGRGNVRISKLVDRAQKFLDKQRMISITNDQDVRSLDERDQS